MPLDHSSTITTFRDQLNRLSADTFLDGLELSIEYNCVSLRPIGTDIIAGVVLELPAGFQAHDLLEGLRIGEANFTKILEALERMATTSSRFDQKFAMDAALGHLVDFSKIIVGIHHCCKLARADSLTPEPIAER